MKIYFHHEKLDAYQKALAFAAWSEAILERTPKSAAVHGQLDRARTSIVLNIPEGNGRFTASDRFWIGCTRKRASITWEAEIRIQQLPPANQSYLLGLIYSLPTKIAVQSAER